MKEYYKKQVEYNEKLFPILTEGFNNKVARIGLKIANTNDLQEIEGLQKDLFDLNTVMKKFFEEKAFCEMRYKQECEKDLNKENGNE